MDGEDRLEFVEQEWGACGIGAVKSWNTSICVSGETAGGS